MLKAVFSNHNIDNIPGLLRTSSILNGQWQPLNATSATVASFSAFIPDMVRINLGGYALVVSISSRSSGSISEKSTSLAKI